MRIAQRTAVTSEQPGCEWVVGVSAVTLVNAAIAWSASRGSVCSREDDARWPRSE
jgi:hypothetical protein